MNTDPVTAAKATAAATAATALAVGGASPILGVPADVFLVACAGALFGLAYSGPEFWKRWLSVPEGAPRRRIVWVVLHAIGLAFTLAANAWVAGIGAQALPHVPFMGWTANITPQATAGLLAFGAQHIIPRAMALLGRWLDKRASP